MTHHSDFLPSLSLRDLVSLWFNSGLPGSCRDLGYGSSGTTRWPRILPGELSNTCTTW
jgi:hypothetical protein